LEEEGENELWHTVREVIGSSKLVRGYWREEELATYNSSRVVSFEDLNGDGLLARFLVDVEARTAFPFEAEPDPDATGSILASRRRGESGEVKGKRGSESWASTLHYRLLESYGMASWSSMEAGNETNTPRKLPRIFRSSNSLILLGNGFTLHQTRQRTRRSLEAYIATR